MKTTLIKYVILIVLFSLVAAIGSFAQSTPAKTEPKKDTVKVKLTPLQLVKIEAYQKQIQELQKQAQQVSKQLEDVIELAREDKPKGNIVDFKNGMLYILPETKK